MLDTLSSISEKYPWKVSFLNEENDTKLCKCIRTLCNGIMEKKKHNVFIYFVYSYLSDLKVTWIFAMPLIKAYSLIFAVPYK